ncbi:hypothetical protein J5N97_003348 [Dioscorea zingiberensis]|uniref:Glutamate receptor n=1 Tax=Dioscorea zingiberensis TaxID=325984 RepID=A0A9D5HR62_9LILI|nr:hypothetical protein J5N97_003348 [Dioscorea zingiberensis]
MGKPRYHLILLLFILFSSPRIGQNKAYAQGINSNKSGNTTTFDVGVILDNSTWIGNISWGCMSMALEDFYNSRSNFNKRISLHLRDVNKDDPVSSAFAAVDLLKNVQVQAIIGPQTSQQAKFIIELGNNSQVPIISFTAKSPSFSSMQSPFFIRTGINDTSQAKVLASLVQHFRWKQVVPIYADTDFGNGIIPHLIDAFAEVDARVPYQSPIPISASDADIGRELEKLKEMQTRVFIVHMEYSLGFKLFSNAKKAGMMDKGYVWITTYGLTDIVDLMGPSATNVMEGVLGIKPYITENNKKLQDFKARWRKRFNLENPFADQVTDPSTVFGLWAYDTVWALAKAAENVSATNYTFSMNNVRNNTTDLESIGQSQIGSELTQKISNTKFYGISGKFHLVDRQLETNSFEIVNVVGNRRLRIGFWTQAYGVSQRLNSMVNVKVHRWPGGSPDAPKGWEWPTNGKKLRIGVPVKPGFPEFVNVSNNSRPTGYCIKVFDLVMGSLPYNVAYNYTPFADPKDSNQMNGTYDDHVSQVYLKKFDAVVGDITVIASRSQYVDFTLPYTESGVCMVVPVKDEHRKNAWTFAEPLSTDLWIASGVFFIFTGIVVWILEHRVNNEFRGPPANQIGTIFYFIFSTLVFSHREKIVSNLSRIVLIIWVFVVLILQQSYTASLSSMLTVQQLQPTITDLSELARSASKVGYLNDSFMPGLLKGFNFDESRLIAFDSPDEYDQALSNGTVAAIVDEIPYIKVFLSKHCGKYTMVGPTYKTDGFGFAFPIGSPMVPDVSRAILNISESGKMDNITYVDVNEDCFVQKDGSYSSRITFRSFWGLFLITGVTSIFAFLIHLAMFLHQHWGTVIYSDSGLSCRQKLVLLKKIYDKPDLSSDAFKEKEEQEMGVVEMQMQSPMSISQLGNEDVFGHEDDDIETPLEDEGTPGREIGGQTPDPPSFADMLNHRRGYDSS